MSKPGAGKELLDDMKEKWAKLNPFAKKPKSWGGEGHKLGSGTAQVSDRNFPRTPFSIPTIPRPRSLVIRFQDLVTCCSESTI